KANEMALSFCMFFPTLPSPGFMPFKKPDYLLALTDSFAGRTFDNVVYFKQIWWQKTVKIPVMTTSSAQSRTFSIISNSLELFIKFLASTFDRQNYNPAENPLEHACKLPKSARDHDRLNFSINFNETLAFRHRLQLKSTKLDMPRTTILQSFKRGNKLKSVLEMFGNTISSIVHRFESIPNSRSDNGENK
ncbi:MAG: hypothetical protein PHD82_16585, partial [Candidatus Riflebacteria bacterium]|nr:hypothetical protein [Candidatus Riflebacteria bacterium]